MVTTTLRHYCELNHEPDRFLVHHGNLSASYRETAEGIMKDDSQYMTTVTTATLELGIDIGRLERAFQIDAPWTVSSFLQRMGRTGKRELPPEMWFVIREDEPEVRAMLPTTIPWKLLQGIALVQLYLEERWVEPPRLDRLPFSLLYHQTMSTLASCGELSPRALADRVLRLHYFHRITQEDYRVLLRHLIATDHIQQTEQGGLIVGLAGSGSSTPSSSTACFRKVRNTPSAASLRSWGRWFRRLPWGEAGHCGTCLAGAGRGSQAPPDLLSAGEGSVPAYFGQCPGDLHTKILTRMRRVLQEDRQYPI